MKTTDKILFSAFAVCVTLIACLPLALFVAITHGITAFVGLWSIVISDVKKVWGKKEFETQDETNVWDRHIQRMKDKEKNL